MRHESQQIRKPGRSVILSLFAVMTTVPALHALEIGIEGRAGNLHFPWSAQTQITGDFPATNYFGGGSAWLSAPLGDEAAFRVSYETDPVLRHRVDAQIQFERGPARISVGPFVGAFNSPLTPLSAGLSTQVRFQLPGIAFAAVRSDGGLAVGVLADSLAEEPQALAELEAGFYVPNAIVFARLTAKRFSETDSSGKRIVDALSRYCLAVDVFKKNVPYNLLALAGYELRSKYYEAADTTDALGSLILGIETNVRVADGVTLRGKLHSGFFVFGLEALSGRGPATDAFIFDASLGIVLDTALLRAQAKAAAGKAPAPAPAGTAPAEPAAGAASGTVTEPGK